MESLEYLSGTEVRAEHIAAVAHRLGLPVNFDEQLGTVGVQCVSRTSVGGRRWSCWMRVPVAEADSVFGTGEAFLMERIAALRPASLWSVDVPGDCGEVASVLRELLRLHGGAVCYGKRAYGVDDIHTLRLLSPAPGG